MWTSRFYTAVNFVLEWETEFEPGHQGDYDHVLTEHDKNDPGGDTRYGIDQRDHPGIDVDTLTVDHARAIYNIGEWGPTHAEQLPGGMGEAVFDAAVNCGVGRSVKWLQTVLINQGSYLGAVDGMIGPQTLAAAQTNPADTLGRLLAIRRDYYERLAQIRPSMEEYLEGWLNRVNALAVFATALLPKA